MNYDLLEEHWIPVLYNDGAFKRVGILDALTHASRIRQIALASPLDLFAVHGFPPASHRQHGGDQSDQHHFDPPPLPGPRNPRRAKALRGDPTGGNGSRAYTP